MPSIKNNFSMIVISLLFMVGIISTSFCQGSGEDKEINRKDMDTTVSPTVDFFEYANGTWLKNTEIPA
ncbi:MAG: hypothetical protein ACYCVH_16755, partial [Ignavibacteriaceae bacterium]